MSDKKSQSIFAESLKGLFKSAFKMMFILIAWILKFSGIAISKIGESIEKIIIKRSST